VIDRDLDTPFAAIRQHPPRKAHATPT
jgi:hypothetical protein